MRALIVPSIVILAVFCLAPLLADVFCTAVSPPPQRHSSFRFPRTKTKVSTSMKGGECGAQPGVLDTEPQYCTSDIAEDRKVKPMVIERRRSVAIRDEEAKVKAREKAETDAEKAAEKALLEQSGKDTADFFHESPKKTQVCGNLQHPCKCKEKEESGGDHADDDATKKMLNTLLGVDAAKYNPVFTKLLNALVAKAGATEKTVTLYEEEAKYHPPHIHEAPIKGKGRCIEKIDMKYGCKDSYGCRSLTDVVRGSLEFADEASLCYFVEQTLMTADGVVFAGDGDEAGKVGPTGDVRVSVRFHKNRFQSDASGMRDLLVNVFLKTKDDAYGHVAELQIHHNSMVAAKSVFHCVYSYLRRINEAMTYLKRDPSDAIFCLQEDLCKDYWFDKKWPQKDNNPDESALQKIKAKWASGSDDLKAKWAKIEEFLVDKNCNSADCKVDHTAAAIKKLEGCNEDPTNLLCSPEYHIYTTLMGYMTTAYDAATSGNGPKLHRGEATIDSVPLYYKETNEACPSSGAGHKICGCSKKLKPKHKDAAAVESCPN